MEKVKYLFPSDHSVLSIAEQDRQEAMFAMLQTQLRMGTISKDGYDNLFTIIHNCALSQLKKRFKGITKRGGMNGISESLEERLENFALDQTCSLLDSMKKGRYVKYIIKTSDYLAMYAIHNAKQKFRDMLDKSSMDIDVFMNYLEENYEFDLSDDGEIKITQKQEGVKLV